MHPHHRAQAKKKEHAIQNTMQISGTRVASGVVRSRRRVHFPPPSRRHTRYLHERGGYQKYQSLHPRTCTLPEVFIRLRPRTRQASMKPREHSRVGNAFERQTHRLQRRRLSIRSVESTHQQSGVKQCCKLIMAQILMISLHVAVRQASLIQGIE